MTKWILLIVAVLLLLAFGVLCYFMGSPRDAYGFLRYGLPQWHEGELRVGDRAPDVEVVSLNGESRFRVLDRLSAKPLVLIFGSYT